MRRTVAQGVQVASKRSFHTKVVGVTFQNDDGSSRQRILKRCRKGEHLVLVNTPIPEDRNAVAVRRASTGEQLGYLSRELAAEIAPKLRRGVRITAEIASLTGGGLIFKRTRGCNIKITIWE